MAVNAADLLRLFEAIDDGVSWTIAEISRGSTVPPRGCSDMRRTLENLLSNARESISGGGGVVLDIKRGSGGGVYPFGVIEPAERFAHLTLTDTGAGK